MHQWCTQEETGGTNSVYTMYNGTVHVHRSGLHSRHLRIRSVVRLVVLQQVAACMRKAMVCCFFHELRVFHFRMYTRLCIKALLVGIERYKQCMELYVYVLDGTDSVYVYRVQGVSAMHAYVSISNFPQRILHVLLLLLLLCLCQRMNASRIVLPLH
jgi:hypothetical protein